jgi:hypothetical protein
MFLHVFQVNCCKLGSGAAETKRSVTKTNCTERDQAATRAVSNPGSPHGTCGGPSSKALRFSLISYCTSATHSYIHYPGDADWARCRPQLPRDPVWPCHYNKDTFNTIPTAWDLRCLGWVPVMGVLRDCASWFYSVPPAAPWRRVL